MFDSQKLSFDKFVTGYKHGVYIITRDACSTCQAYKKQIEYINNRYLYFVETTTKAQEIVAKQLHDRLAFPMTAAWKDNQLIFVRLGERYGEDWTEIMEFLKQFGDVPLTKEEINERIERLNAKCIISFYIFPDNMPEETRKEIINGAYDRHELPIDIDKLCPDLELSKRTNMILSYMGTGKYILWNINGEFGPFKSAILGEYFSKVGRPVETREYNG